MARRRPSTPTAEDQALLQGHRRPACCRRSIAIVGGTTQGHGARAAGSSSRASRPASARCCCCRSLCGGGLGLIGLMADQAAVACFVGRRVVGFALPFVYLNCKRSKRLRKFEEEFPEALDLIARALKAGHAFVTGLKMVADEMPEPVGPEFRKTFDEQNFGLPLKDALENLTDARPVARRAVLLDRGADPARDRRQPVGDPREPGARRARALQDPAPGARLHRARPLDRLRAAGAAGGAVHRAGVHQPGSHEPAVPRAASARCC